MKRILTILAALFFSLAAFAQGQLVTWSSHVESTDDADIFRVVFTGKIASGYHTYTLTDEFSATEFMDVEISGGELSGDPYEMGTPVEETDEFGDLAKHYYDEIVIAGCEGHFRCCGLYRNNLHKCVHRRCLQGGVL